MGGFFGATSLKNCVPEVFFGTDYHSHLGTRRGGMAAYDVKLGMQREIHSIENSPFRTKFDGVLDEMYGNVAIGCISDSDPQPIIIRSKLGVYAMCTIGRINNSEELIDKYLRFTGSHFQAMTGGRVNSNELIATLIHQKESFAEGIRFVHDSIDGTAAILIMKEDGNLIAARDKEGRLPLIIGKDALGHCVTFEDFAGHKLGYTTVRELGPGEIVEISPREIEVLSPPRKKKKVCSFLWSYYGYSTSCYEGINVEVMRYKNGRIMARADMENNNVDELDYVCGVPDSGTPHAIGYSNESGIAFARPFIKYTPTWPRSFMPSTQSERSMIAKMKQIPVHDLIRDKKLLFVDDSIVRGTQLRSTVDFLYEHGAEEVHMRSACPPIMFSCKYLNFSRSTSDNDLITRSTIIELEGEEGLKYLEEYMDGTTERGRKMRKAICDKFHFSSLEYQTLEGIVEAIGMSSDELCTYCWNGKE
ncbi:MAG: amidophosphoribosyltransferase [Ruminococcaceae bacterium]|nr:amidophosphoribosyltransferase [Oscillospiraceae bacterium]